jgi:two-component system sensor histidine kinase ChvG
LWRPISVKIVLVLAMFVAVPVLVYDQFRAANDETNRLLVASIEAQGKLIAEALRPGLETADGAAMTALARAVQRLGALGPEIKLLFRPEAVAGSFFYVASSPTVSAQYLERERQELVRLGVLDRLAPSCEQAGTTGFRYTNPDGAIELLTSITVVRTGVGCWVVITADRSPEALGTALGQLYWKTAAVGTAAAIYVAMALGVLALLVQLWLGLRRFRRLARALRTGAAERGSFMALNRIPELAGTARPSGRGAARVGRSPALHRRGDRARLQDAARHHHPEPGAPAPEGRRRSARSAFARTDRPCPRTARRTGIGGPGARRDPGRYHQSGTRAGRSVGAGRRYRRRIPRGP